MIKARFLAVAVLLVVGAVGAWAFRAAGPPPSPGAGRPAEAAKPVSATDAVARPMPVLIDAIGHVETQQSVVVRSRIDGVVDKVWVEDGQEVRAGDRLITLDARQAQAALAQAEGAVLRDKAQLENARRDLARLEPLARAGAVSRQLLDQAVGNVAALEGTLAADQAQVESSKVQLSYTEIRAPIGGRIGTIGTRLGTSVRAADATAVVTINQLDPIYVNYAVPQRELAALQDAMTAGSVPVRVVVAGREKQPLEGKVAYIDNTIDATSGTLSVRATVANPDRRLWPGQFVNTTTTVRIDQQAVVIPAEALQTGQNGTFVFLIKPDMTVTTRPVVVDRVLGDSAVIRSGIAAGDKVVTSGQLRLSEGSKVEIRPPAAPANTTPGARPEKPS
ncbi:efflux RND transporter periplasmic adaptor subunit [Vineibacter terrae]|uniref:efflux RND transporter periplasmic adaptor subunit n=1 Tax=Vineibacter terrae TaxID=2586908 RepID=UPI002E3092C3|nr:efflux RND transporter periplasmic adaptor subunit [Vineibacter terrae]HEX2886923.1 efflux RND transporter periplasmic adaptor subunit [Vineibacter terrae]